MAKVKISELPALTPATLDTTFVVGISGSTTYKISINQLTSSLDTTFATDLVTAALSSSLNSKLSTSSFNSYTTSYTTDSSSFNSRIISGSAVAGTISSSIQISGLGFITASTPTDLSSLNTISASYLSFTQSYYSASSSFDSRIDGLENATSSYLTSLNGAISSSTQISDLGFVTGSYTTITSFNSLTQSFNQISQSFTTISGSFDSIDFSGINTITASYLSFTQSYYSASASFDNRIDSLENATSSYLTSLNGAISSSAQVLNGSGIFSSSAQLPTGLVSSSSQIFIGSGVASGSYETTGRGIISSSTQLPTGLVSGSSQILNGSGIFSSSAQLPTGLISSSTQFPSNLISGSSQISSLGFITSSTPTDLSALNTISASYLSFTQSYYSASASFDSRIIAATNEQNLSGYATTGSNTFIGNQTISGSLNITPTQPSIGDSLEGGKVAYILTSSDAGYDPTLIKGIIVATTDQSSGIQWYNGAYTTTGATGTAIGTGLSNTDAIIASQGATSTNYAAGLARAYGGGGYSDWYLPSKDELNQLYLNRVAIGGFTNNYYWSSTEATQFFSWRQNLNGGTQDTLGKSGLMYVRAVRTFSIPALTVVGNTTISGSLNVTGSVSATSFNGTINATNGIFSSSTQLPTGLLSSSLGFVATSSYSTDSASFNSRIISGSSVAGTISGSAQISAFGFATTGSSVPAWTSAGETTITATTTNPTKGTRTSDNISYRQLGAKEWEVVMTYIQTAFTGGANGSGDYLITLPNGLSFDTTLPSQQITTTNIGTNTYALMTYIIPSGGGLINNGSLGGQVYPIVYSATKFRILTTTWAGSIQCWGSGYYSIGGDTPKVQLTFRFTST